MLFLVTCDKDPVGTGNGYVPDSRITASSILNDKTKPKYARFNGPSAWCASKNDLVPVLQIDLGVRYILCAVATQGNVDNDDMVTKYLFATSLDNSEWKRYQKSGVDLVSNRTFSCADLLRLNAP